MDNLANARMSLSDAELHADTDPDKSQAYTAIANAWIRIEELAVQKTFNVYFERKSFK